jgi:hypothetical protein
MALTAVIAAAIIPVIRSEFIDYQRDDKAALLEFVESRPVVGDVTTPTYMHVGDSRVVEALPDEGHIRPDTKCELSAPGLIVVALPTDPGKCAWAVTAKDDGSKLMVATATVSSWRVDESKSHRKVRRRQMHRYVGWNTVRVAQSPFSATSIATVGSVLAIATTLVGLYLQAAGKTSTSAKSDVDKPKVADPSADSLMNVTVADDDVSSERGKL